MQRLALCRFCWDFPANLEDFSGERFTLLWRGSRDGFKAKEFHRRCDGHANTLTVILDTNGNIFGGFTPVEWESHGSYTADPSQKSFLFTWKNPHNCPARRFALKAKEKELAIWCDIEKGPSICDTVVSDACNANTDSSTSSFGSHYINDTGLDGTTFFTAGEHFQVKEIEVFEITE
jgi:hypothetical protein